MLHQYHVVSLYIYIAFGIIRGFTKTRKVLESITCGKGDPLVCVCVYIYIYKFGVVATKKVKYFTLFTHVHLVLLP